MKKLIASLLSGAFLTSVFLTSLASLATLSSGCVVRPGHGWGHGHGHHHGRHRGWR
jgi:hypothetical protein